MSSLGNYFCILYFFHFFWGGGKIAFPHEAYSEAIQLMRNCKERLQFGVLYIQYHRFSQNSSRKFLIFENASERFFFSTAFILIWVYSFFSIFICRSVRNSLRHRVFWTNFELSKPVLVFFLGPFPNYLHRNKCFNFRLCVPEQRVLAYCRPVYLRFFPPP